MTNSKLVKSAGRKPPNAGKGRKKGVPNKTTAAIRSAIVEAFEQAGGVDYLTRLAETEPRIFCALLAKVLPTQPQDDAPTHMTITWAEPSWMKSRAIGKSSVEATGTNQRQI